MRRRPRFVPVSLLLFGLIPLFNVTTKPRFETYYKPDVVALVAAGMCFGAPIVWLVALRRGTHTL